MFEGPEAQWGSEDQADHEHLVEHTPQRLIPTDGNLVSLLIGSQALAVRLVSS